MTKRIASILLILFTMAGTAYGAETMLDYFKGRLPATTPPAVTDTMPIMQGNGTAMRMIKPSDLSFPWAGIAGKPSVFTPSVHNSSHRANGTDPLSISASQVTDLPAPPQYCVDYFDGRDSTIPGPQGIQGIQGVKGDTGPGVAPGGATGQILRKASSSDFDTEWGDPTSSIPWGSVTGTLSDQQDLQNALNGKEPANSNIQAHIGSTNNPHSTTAAQIGAEPAIGYPTTDNDCLKRQTQGSGGVWSFGSCGTGAGFTRLTETATGIVITGTLVIK